jgi:PTH1 family peptidyl-tRNA hydrolase
MATNRIICGLGNPGPEYAETPHNLGFWVVDLLCERFGGRWKRPFRDARVSRFSIGRSPVTLLQPLTFMNLSGGAVDRVVPDPVEEFDTTAILVICDDTALSLGRLRLRQKGSDGGHNGLASIIEALGTTRFPRLRLGVGPVPEGEDQSDFVLGPFSAGDVKTARRMARCAADCAEMWVREGVDPAMTRFNTRDTDSQSGGVEREGD